MSERRKPPDPARLATLWTRRDVLTRSGWVLVVSGLGVATAGTVRGLFPRVQFTPPTTVVLGAPGEFAVGEVSTRWKKSHGVILVRTAAGFYAIRAVCTHLGCIVAATPDGFSCPCHGSRFSKQGRVLQGPVVRGSQRHGGP